MNDDNTMLLTLKVPFIRCLCFVIPYGRKLEVRILDWLERVLHVSWRDKIPNTVVKDRAGQAELGCIIRRKRLVWLDNMDR